MATSPAASNRLRSGHTGLAPHPLLLVEDDAIVARAVARLLGQLALPVDVKSRCSELAGVAKRYSVGVFDIELPDGLGTDLASQMLSEERVAAVVFFTGATFQPLLKRAIALGPVVSKHDEPAKLVSAVSDGLARGHNHGPADSRWCMTR